MIQQAMPIEESESEGEGEIGLEESIPTHKWVPVINDFCIGCGKCVDACPHNCLKPVWDFATLVQPNTCTSAADCIPVCEDDAIRMQWVALEECDRSVGDWCSNPPDPPPPPRRSFLRRFLWLFKES